MCRHRRERLSPQLLAAGIAVAGSSSVWPRPSSHQSPRSAAVGCSFCVRVRHPSATRGAHRHTGLSCLHRHLPSCRRSPTVRGMTPVALLLALAAVLPSLAVAGRDHYEVLGLKSDSDDGVYSPSLRCLAGAVSRSAAASAPPSHEPPPPIYPPRRSRHQEGVPKGAAVVPSALSCTSPPTLLPAALPRSP